MAERKSQTKKKKTTHRKKTNNKKNRDRKNNTRTTKQVSFPSFNSEEAGKQRQ